jgi:hypothetical protein
MLKLPKYYCNLKRRNTQNASRRPVWPHPLRTQFVLSEVQSVCYFPDSLQLDGYCAEPTQCTCDHTDEGHEPHASRRNEQLDPWPRILNLCSASASPNIMDRHRSTSQIDFSHRHSRTPRDFTKSFCPLFHRKHSDSPDFQTLALI